MAAESRTDTAVEELTAIDAMAAAAASVEQAPPDTQATG